MNADIHVGEVIEEIVRSNQLSISDLARRIHVNRRSVYNWFKQKNLRPYTLQRICYVLVYDFSIKLPEFFNKEFPITNLPPSGDKSEPQAEPEADQNAVQYWMNKYIYILEKYNEILARGTKEHSDSKK